MKKQSTKASPSLLDRLEAQEAARREKLSQLFEKALEFTPQIDSLEESCGQGAAMFLELGSELRAAGLAGRVNQMREEGYTYEERIAAILLYNACQPGMSPTTIRDLLQRNPKHLEQIKVCLGRYARKLLDTPSDLLANGPTVKAMMAAPNPTRDAWLRVSEAALIAGCNTGVITRAVDRGALKSNGLRDDERRIDVLDLTRWILERAKRPESQESDEAVEKRLREATRKISRD